MKNFINFLPPWVETNIQPAFYDKESGTCLQQTARMYAKVNQLIRHFNELSKETKETVDEYIAKFVELKDFVDTYFENLDVQEEINNKLDDMAEDGTLQQILGEYFGIITPRMFGAVSDTNTDQSQAIIDCLTYAFENGIKNVYLDGNYFVDSAIAFEKKSNVSIKNGTIRVHETDDNLSEGFNVFSFDGCTNINIENVNIIETNPVNRTRHLYTGGIYFNNSTRCSVTKCYMENTHNGIMLKGHSDDCIVDGNTVNVTYQNNQFAQSAILNYGSSSNIIKSNELYGEYYDGVLSVFGGGSKDVIVDGNILNSAPDGNHSTLVQGITIDQGCINTIVTNNIVTGYFYGIDNKSSVVNTSIKNNLLIANKIAIADREGDGVTGKTFGCDITDNKIVIRKDWDTDTLGSYLHLNKYYYVGVLVGLMQRGVVKNNNIVVYGTLDKALVGIAVRSYETTNQYYQVNDISGNNIELATGFGNTTSNAPTNSTGIAIYDLKNGIVTNNTFKVETSANHYTFIELYGTNARLEITNNMCHGTSMTNHFFIEKVDSATIIQSNVYDNLIDNLKFVINLESITNIVEYTKRAESRGHRIKSYDYTANTFKSVATFKPDSDGVIRLTIKSLGSVSGTKVIDCCYAVSVSGTTVTATEIYDNNKNVEVQFVNNGTARNITLQIKYPNSVTLSASAGVFTMISDIFATQNITIADA